jgi:hypothetical protein
MLRFFLIINLLCFPGVLHAAPELTEKKVPTAENKTIQQDYFGPLSLKWGMSADAVKELLSKELEFQREFSHKEGLYEQAWAGKFAGMDADEIGIGFFPKELALVTVAFYKKETEPLLKTFDYIYKLMLEKYGKESENNRPEIFDNSLNLDKKYLGNTKKSAKIKELTRDLSQIQSAGREYERNCTI